jgi:hypothetical protein
MSTINGHGAKPPPEEPAAEIARWVYEANLEEGDAAWADLSDPNREALTDYARVYIGAHVQWLSQTGYRIISPDAVERPTSQEQALAMVQVAKEFFDAQKRKGKLVGAVAPTKLILPKGVH